MTMLRLKRYRSLHMAQIRVEKMNPTLAHTRLSLDGVVLGEGKDGTAKNLHLTEMSNETDYM